MIYERFGRIFLKTDKGTYASVDELERVISGLTSTLKNLKAGYSIDEIRRWAAIGIISHAEKHGAWIIPTPDEYDQYETGGVYFMYYPNSDLIKIGKTHNLKQRMNTYRWELNHGQSPVELLLFIAVDNPLELEGAFHEFYKSQWVEKELYNLDTATRDNLLSMAVQS